MTRHSVILQDLFASNIFTGFHTNADQVSLRNIGDPIFEQLIDLLKPKTIVEVGSWKGSSAIHMAQIVKKLHIDCVIICIDTWLGSPEHWVKKNDSKTWGHQNLKLKHGYPTLYYTFLNNLISKGCEDIIIPLPSTSENAVKILKKQKICPELIYIDAAHEFKPAYRDCEEYWKLLSPEGILFGDDYEGWQGVTKAAKKFAKHVEKPLYGKRGKFVIPNGDYKLDMIPIVNL